MKLIAIETATEICSIAYLVEGECVALIEKQIPRQHAEKLPLFYKELVNQTNLDLSKIDGIAVSIGPGSFTGLRIGLSYAKGLAYSHKLPLVPVPTLQSLTYGSGITDGEFVVMMYSHGKKYFVQQSGVRNQGSVGSIQVLTCESIDDIGIDIDSTKIVHWNCDRLFDGVQNKQDIISVTPSANLIGELAHQYYDEWVVDEPYKLVPEYVSELNIGKLGN